jgi:hypothetical protein
MAMCRLCREQTPLDDVAVGSFQGRFICLRCLAHYAETPRPMPRRLRRLIEDVLAPLDEAAA